MQVIRASNSCHGKLGLLKAGNPRRTFPLRSVFSTFPTDRKFEFKLEIKGNRRYELVLVCSCSHDSFLPAILTVEVYPELRYYYFILLGGGATFCRAAISKCSLT